MTKTETRQLEHLLSRKQAEPKNRAPGRFYPAGAVKVHYECVVDEYGVTESFAVYVGKKFKTMAYSLDQVTEIVKRYG